MDIIVDCIHDNLLSVIFSCVCLNRGGEGNLIELDCLGF